jgi:acetolactate synthase-1/2/3 large subunit
VACDSVILRFFDKADLLVGMGFEPVESEKLWHHTLNLVSIGPMSIAADDFAPPLELVGDTNQILAAFSEMSFGPFGWADDDLAAHRTEMEQTLQPAQTPEQGISPWEMVQCLRKACPPDTVATTDVGSVKFVTTQGWLTREPLTFLESNGLSTMGYALPAAMAARLHFPDRPILCTVGDGGFAMSFADLETCVREGLNFVTVVFNDSALSLIRVIQDRKSLPPYSLEFGAVDFAAASAALGAWSRRVETLSELEEAITEALRQDRPAVIDAIIDPTEYTAHAAPPTTN